MRRAVRVRMSFMEGDPMMVDWRRGDFVGFWLGNRDFLGLVSCIPVEMGM